MNLPDLPDGPECNRNSGQREDVTLICEVRQGTRPWQIVRLEDISERGFRIGWLPNTSPHAPLRIRIPGLHVLSANIRWQRGDAIGCEFTAPLHVAVFEHIVRQAG